MTKKKKNVALQKRESCTRDFAGKPQRNEETLAKNALDDFSANGVVDILPRLFLCGS